MRHSYDAHTSQLSVILKYIFCVKNKVHFISHVICLLTRSLTEVSVQSIIKSFFSTFFVKNIFQPKKYINLLQTK